MRSPPDDEVYVVLLWCLQKGLCVVNDHYYRVVCNVHIQKQWRGRGEKFYTQVSDPSQTRADTPLHLTKLKEVRLGLSSHDTSSRTDTPRVSNLTSLFRLLLKCRLQPELPTAKPVLLSSLVESSVFFSASVTTQRPVIMIKKTSIRFLSG